jgi:hypothetical protein
LFREVAETKPSEGQGQVGPHCAVLRDHEKVAVIVGARLPVRGRARHRDTAEESAQRGQRGFEKSRPRSDVADGPQPALVTERIRSPSADPQQEISDGREERRMIDKPSPDLLRRRRPTLWKKGDEFF